MQTKPLRLAWWLILLATNIATFYCISSHVKMEKVALFFIRWYIAVCIWNDTSPKNPSDKDQKVSWRSLTLDSFKCKVNDSSTSKIEMVVQYSFTAINNLLNQHRLFSVRNHLIMVLKQHHFSGNFFFKECFKTL